MLKKELLSKKNSPFIEEVCLTSVFESMKSLEIYELKNNHI